MKSYRTLAAEVVLMRGSPLVLGGACLMCGCLGLLGGDGVPTPIEAGTAHDAASDRAGREAGREASLGSGAIAVASGSFEPDSCAVTVDGDVECWGNNENGQLGDGTTTPSATPVKVQGIHGHAVEVSVGVDDACARTGAGAVYCWGQGEDGELGDGKTTPISTTAVPVVGLDQGVTAVSCGNVVCCAVQTGKLLCWGYGQNLLLGSARTADALIPTPVPGFESSVTAVSVGINVACAVKDGGAYCWGGFDGSGELGNGTMNGSATPVQVHGLTSGVVAISAGADFACAITKTHGVDCWGDGVYGTLGNGEYSTSPVPVEVQRLGAGVDAVSAGFYSACAITTGGAVLCWGDALDGELGNGQAEADGGGSSFGPASAFPVKVSALSGPAVSISTGETPCAATSQGRVECWGITPTDSVIPVPVTGIGASTALSASASLPNEGFACAMSGGVVFCWGANDYGQLGNGTTASSSRPVTGWPGGATAMAAGDDFACTIASGIVYCSGANDSGQLGNGTKGMSVVRSAVLGLPGGALAVSAGDESACAIVPTEGGAGGALYCWGDNSFGQLGTGNVTPSLVAAPVMGLGSGVTAVSVGAGYTTCAVLSDGTARCWGYNGSGLVGDGTQTMRLSPTPVSGLTGTTAISVGWYTACAVTSGIVQCWGDNTFGQLGNNNLGVPTLVPVTVSGVPTGATSVSVGNTSACAVVNGYVRCWGNGPIGNDTSPSLVFESPATEAKGLSGATAVAVGQWFACAAAMVPAPGVYCWGFNNAGELGNGSPTDTFTPMPVAGFP